MKFGAGRRRGDFVNSVERANIYAEHARTSDASGGATPHLGRCELGPTTAVRLRAQVKYSKRSRAAYGHPRSRSGVRPRSSRTMSLASRTGRTRDVGIPLTVISLRHLQPFATPLPDSAPERDRRPFRSAFGRYDSHPDAPKTTVPAVVVGHLSLINAPGGADSRLPTRDDHSC